MDVLTVIAVLLSVDGLLVFAEDSDLLVVLEEALVVAAFVVLGVPAIKGVDEMSPGIVIGRIGLCRQASMPSSVGPFSIKLWIHCCSSSQPGGLVG